MKPGPSGSGVGAIPIIRRSAEVTVGSFRGVVEGRRGLGSQAELGAHAGDELLVLLGRVAGGQQIFGSLS